MNEGVWPAAPYRCSVTYTEVFISAYNGARERRCYDGELTIIILTCNNHPFLSYSWVWVCSSERHIIYIRLAPMNESAAVQREDRTLIHLLNSVKGIYLQIACVSYWPIVAALDDLLRTVNRICKFINS